MRTVPTMRDKRLPLKYYFIAAFAAVMVIFSLIFTLFGGRVAWIPTWEDLYVWSGFREPGAKENEFRVTVFDVGKSDCTLVQSGDHAVLIDTGSSRYDKETVKSLSLHGVTKLDMIVISWLDGEHLGAMTEIIRTFPVDSVVMPFVTPSELPDTNAYRKAMAAMESVGVKPTYAEYGTEYAIGNATLKILSGRNDPEFSNTDTRSIICRVFYKNSSMLFMGTADTVAEKALLHSHEDIKADAIKIARYGDESASSVSFIKAVQPQIAVISCEFFNSDKLPHQKTLQTLNEAGATVYRTDTNGDITVIGNGETLRVETKR